METTDGAGPLFLEQKRGPGSNVDEAYLDRVMDVIRMGMVVLSLT